MKTNMGTIDRALRVIVGLVLIALAVTQTVGWWGWLGVIPVLTGSIGICPLYSIIGVNTCCKKNCDKT